MNVSVAYIAAAFPARSETFVYREVRGLRAEGWEVRTVSLNEPGDNSSAELADLRDGTVYLYGGGKGATVWAALSEAAIHPLRTLGTIGRAIGDALNPGERMRAGARVKLVAQAVAAVGAAKELRQAGVRHLHCHFAHAPTTVGMYAARQLGIPFSFTGHANDLFQRRALLSRKLERAAFVACISEWHRDFYREIRQGGDERYPVIRCGVDVASWTPKADTGREIPPGETLHVLTVCRLVEKKGVDTLIRGLAMMSAETKRRWRLTVAGDGPERARLEALATELACFDSIDWLGAVGNERVRELFSKADVFALPCREDSHGDRDGIPVVLMEAMACGVPVLAGDLPAIRELVVNNSTGLLVPGDQPQQVALDLGRLANDPSLRARLALEGRRHVENEFSLHTNLARLRRQITAVALPAEPV